MALGKSIPRIDTVMKAKGETQYVGDIRFDGMLHGKVVWSSHPHAEIVSIDTKQADQIPGVRLVLTAKDIPGKNLYGVLVVDQPVLAENRVLYIGEPVAVVFAEDFATAEKGAQAVKVTYKELPGVVLDERRPGRRSTPAWRQ